MKRVRVISRPSSAPMAFPASHHQLSSFNVDPARQAAASNHSFQRQQSSMQFTQSSQLSQEATDPFLSMNASQSQLSSQRDGSLTPQPTPSTPASIASGYLQQITGRLSSQSTNGLTLREMEKKLTSLNKQCLEMASILTKVHDSVEKVQAAISANQVTSEKATISMMEANSASLKSMIEHAESAKDNICSNLDKMAQLVIKDLKASSTNQLTEQTTTPDVPASQTAASIFEYEDTGEEPHKKTCPVVSPKILYTDPYEECDSDEVRKLMEKARRKRHRRRN